MKPRLIAVLVLASALPLLAQQSGGDQDLELVRPPTGGTFIQWEAKAGRTYFVQVSNPAAPLQKWVFAPTIEVGVGQTISYEVPSTADKGFFRLKYTDIPIPSGVSPEDADPDGDGLTNEVELTGTETDPLEADTDHDSLPDGWEAGHGLDPNDDGSGSVDNGPEGDPDHDGVPNGDEWDADTDPSNADSDSDGITDGGELDQGSDPNDPVDKPEAEWFVLTGDSPQGVAKSRSRTVTIPKGESRLVVVMLASEEYPGFTGTSSNFNDVLTWNIAGSGLAMNGTVDVNSRHAAWETDAQNGISCLGFSPAHLEEYHSVQAPPDADLDVTIALTATNVSDWRYPSTAMVGLLPLELRQENMPNIGVAENTTDMASPYDSALVKGGGVAYITGEPAMPKLKASISGLDSNLDVDWSSSSGERIPGHSLFAMGGRWRGQAA